MTSPRPPEHFPYVWTPERDLPSFLHVRAEGLPLREAIWSGLGYLRKYARGKWTAPPEEVRYFDEQRRLLRRLAAGPEEGVRLALVGDLMWLRDNWGTFLSPEVLAHLNAHDAVVGNLETPISARFRVPGLLPDYFTYNSDPRLVTSFRRPGGASTFSALATANNHCLDRGDAGLADTLAFLEGLGIPHAGVRRRADDRSWVSFEAGGLRFGFYAACWGLNNPAAVRSSAFHIEVLDGLAPRVRPPLDLGRVRAALDEMAAAGVDFRIVGLHWGHEFELYPAPELVQVGREVIRAGADVVAGSHSHVVGPLEVCFVNGYEERYRRQGLDSPAMQGPTGALVRDGTGVPRKALVAYSLGNFATAMYTLHCRVGLILSLRLARDAETGRIDWHRPEPQLVYNAHRDPVTRRRCLALVETYLRDRERRGDDAPALRRMAEWLRRHLLGGD
jgi:poly-gamma-glutamate capsule biosynthesis protein CapA/YwtB (metallophosphatase superfamily)